MNCAGNIVLSRIGGRHMSRSGTLLNLCGPCGCLLPPLPSENPEAPIVEAGAVVLDISGSC